MKTKRTLLTLISIIAISLIALYATAEKQDKTAKGEKKGKGNKTEIKAKFQAGDEVVGSKGRFAPEGRFSKGNRFGMEGRFNQRGRFASQHRFGNPDECEEMDEMPFLDRLNGITDEQKSKIKEIHDSFKKDRDEIFESINAKEKELQEIIKSDPSTPNEIKAKSKEIGKLREQLMEKRIDSMFAAKNVLNKEQQQQAKGFRDGWKARSEAEQGFRHKMIQNRMGKGEFCPNKEECNIERPNPENPEK